MSQFNLSGLRVLNTRPRAQSLALEQAIQTAGGLSIRCPAIEICPTDTQWILEIPDLNQVDKAIFISTNAVHYFFDGLKQKNLHWPENILVLAIGEATRKALEAQGLRKILTPKIADSEHLIHLASMQNLHGQYILLIKGAGGREVLAKYIQQQGAKLKTIDVYCRTKPVIDPAVLGSIWRNDAVDIILYTSQQAMAQVFELFGEQAESWLRHKPCLVISERLAEAARQLGIQTIHVAPPERIVEALHQFRQRN